MDDFGYCDAWPDELKRANNRRMRAVYRLQNLQNYIKRADPAEFDSVMEQLEAAYDEVHDSAMEFLELNYEYCNHTSIRGK